MGWKRRFFVVHCVFSSVIMLFVGCWLFVVDLKLVCTRWSDRLLFLFSARMGGLGQICWSTGSSWMIPQCFFKMGPMSLFVWSNVMMNGRTLCVCLFDLFLWSISFCVKLVIFWNSLLMPLISYPLLKRFSLNVLNCLFNRLSLVIILRWRSSWL